MYVVVVYDMEAERTQLMLNHLRKYLTHVQNSVCEGEISPSDFDEMKTKAESIAKEGESVIVYNVTNDSWLDRCVIGYDPKKDSRFI